jgi:hypothetical protein
VNSTKTYLILLLALTTIGGAMLAWRQYAELVELRAAAMNTNERAELQKKIWDLQKANRELQDQLAALRAEHPDGNEVVTGEDRSRGGPPEAQRPGPPNGRGPSAEQQAMRELMSKPEVQAMITSEQKALLDYRYGALFRNLNLPPEQLEKLKTLLVDRQNVAQDVFAAASAQGIDPRQDRDTFNKMISDARSSVNDTIKSVLGDAGYNQLTAYDQTMPQRNLVSVLQQRLSYSDPLTPSQADQLVQALAANPAPSSGDGQRRLVDGGGIAGRFTGGVGPSINAVVGPGAVTITPGAVNQAQAVLTPPQLAALQQLQQQQQTANQLEQLRRNALQNAGANNPPSGDGGSGQRRRGGG